MRIAILGTGNMGKAIIAGVKQKLAGEATIIAFDKSSAALSGLDKSVQVLPPNTWFKQKSKPDVVVIAVKPQDIESSLKSLKAVAPKGKNGPLWLSIAAGVTLGKLTTLLGSGARVCRVMPNTPALVGEAVSAYALGDSCKPLDTHLAETVLSSFGVVTRVPEKMMDAITGLSGSGPAYVYLFIEALIEGGVTAGLPLDVARLCAVQTVFGAALMMRESNDAPSVLKSRVMSPGGTTAKGLMELEKHGFKYGIIQAVTRAAERAAELGK
jgi:pyrroline-5-carboxylate reductase